MYLLVTKQVDVDASLQSFGKTRFVALQIPSFWERSPKFQRFLVSFWEQHLGCPVVVIRFGRNRGEIFGLHAALVSFITEQSLLSWNWTRLPLTVPSKIPRNHVEPNPEIVSNEHVVPAAWSDGF